VWGWGGEGEEKGHGENKNLETINVEKVKKPY